MNVKKKFQYRLGLEIGDFENETQYLCFRAYSKSTELCFG